MPLPMLIGPTGCADARVAEAQRNFQKAVALNRDARRTDKDVNYMSPERAAADREVDVAKATISGDRERVVSLENMGRFADHYERMRQIYGDKGAVDPARKLAEADIMNSAPGPAVDNLARLGLGGEVGGGTDVQKQIRDLNKQMLDYLTKIDAKLGGPGAENNPMGIDDNPPL